jgi:transposase-like protein
MPRRKGPRRLKPAVVRAIFKSVEPVVKTAKKFGVSANLVYLIHGRKIHREVTEDIRAPRRTGRRRRRSTLSVRAATVKVDLDKLADRIVRHFLKRFRARG